MKKINIFFLLIGILHSSSLHSQIKGEANYLIKYEANFAFDSTDREERTIEMHSLYTGDKTSYYVSDLFIALDSIISQFRENPQAGMRRMRGNFIDMPRPEFIAKVYKDLEKKEALIQATLIRDQVIYEEEDFPVSWNISDETKEIGEYLAQKAVTDFGGRKWEAWFTFQVPIQDGPYIFSGLPGLILELSDSDNDYQFSVTSIKPLKEKYSINSDSREVKKTSKSRFITRYKNFRENPLGEFADRLRNSEMQFPDPITGEMISVSDLIRRAKQEAAKRNNYIERF